MYAIRSYYGLMFLGFRIDDWEFRVLILPGETVGGRQVFGGDPHMVVVEHISYNFV